jgi:BASS family bile acid:Na+ symporter
MLQFLIDFAVPVTIFVSMLISGTEARAADLPNVVTTNRTLVLGSEDQLLVLLFVALLTQILAQPSQLVTTSLLLLALCQGGGISKYYSYVARCNVPVSATITALSIILSFFYQLRLQRPLFSSVRRGSADRRIFSPNRS